jgi:hypothetical protein
MLTPRPEFAPKVLNMVSISERPEAVVARHSGEL